MVFEKFGVENFRQRLVGQGVLFRVSRTRTALTLDRAGVAVCLKRARFEGFSETVHGAVKMSYEAVVLCRYIPVCFTRVRVARDEIR